MCHDAVPWLASSKQPHNPAPLVLIEQSPAGLQTSGPLHTGKMQKRFLNRDSLQISGNENFTTKKDKRMFIFMFLFRAEAIIFEFLLHCALSVGRVLGIAIYHHHPILSMTFKNNPAISRPPLSSHQKPFISRLKQNLSYSTLTFHFFWKCKEKLE